MCPACLCCLTRRADLATGPDEIRVSATNHSNAIMSRLGKAGIVRSAVTLRVWLSVIISLALLLPDLFLRTNGQNYGPNFTPSLFAPGALAPSCGSRGHVVLTLGQNSPRDTSHLVGQGYRGNALWFASRQLFEPLTARGLLNPVASQL